MAGHTPWRELWHKNEPSSGFRYLLLLENGEPADPACFVANATWSIGDVFFAPGGQRFRILDMQPPPSAAIADDITGIWTVAPVERRPPAR